MAECEPGLRTEPRWVRPLIVVAAAVVFLASGAAGGLLLGLARPGSEAAVAPGPVAVGFVQDMIAHRGQAVQIAAWSRDHGSDPEVRRLAATIGSTAAPEMGRMQGWLDIWGAPQEPSGGSMRWMVVDAGDAHAHGEPPAAGTAAPMPGMATEEELRRLRTASGPDLDVLFLQLMLRHHEEGEPMLDAGTQSVGLPSVRDLGVRIVDEEAAEGNRLRELLAELDVAPLPG